MNWNYSHGILTCLACAALIALVAWPLNAAQPPVDAGTQNVQPPAPGPEPGPGPRFRDPTQPSPGMRDAIEAEKYVPNPTGGPTTGPTMPQIKLLARLIGSIGLPTAVIDVNGQAYRVQLNNQIQINGSEAKLIVLELDEAGVLVELQPLKRTVLLN